MLPQKGWALGGSSIRGVFLCKYARSGHDGVFYLQNLKVSALRFLKYSVGKVAYFEIVKKLSFLRSEAVSELKNKRGGEVFLNLKTFSSDSLANFSQWLDSSDHRVVAGLFGDAVVAYGVLEFASTNDRERIASIKELFVMEDARSVGVGECLMDFLVNQAIENKVIGIDSFALPGDRETKNFFESQGMVARLIQVYRPIESGNDKT